MRASRSAYRTTEFEENPADGQEQSGEDMLIASLRPELNYICSNATRACIMYMMVKNKELDHTIRVEELSRRLGKRHSVIIYHLEQLQGWKIVKVVKLAKYGEDGTKRSIWGLNLNYPNLVREAYAYMSKVFYTQKDLERMCSVNRNVRASK
jgi:hypothetical protein